MWPANLPPQCVNLVPLEDGECAKSTYNLETELRALKSTVELFSNPEAPPELSVASGDSKREIYERVKGSIANISAIVLTRKVEVIGEKQRVTDEFKAFAKEHPEDLDAAIKQLDDCIEAISVIIERSKSRIADNRAGLDRSLADLAAKSVGDAKITRRMINKFFVILHEYHNQVVELFYFLSAVRAEYSADSRGGPSFKDPAALGDYLREQMKV
jgi:hypothetical protein